MAKKRKSKRRPSGQPQAQFPSRRTASTRPDTIEGIVSLPVIGGPRGRERELAWAYLEQFSSYEDWILDGRPQSGVAELIEAIPEEHRMVIGRWPDAFEVYRHSLWIYLERALKINPWTSTIQSLASRAELHDPEGFRRFAEIANDGAARYWQQRRNADRTQRDMQHLPTYRQKIRQGLQAYVDYYEIDYPIWFIGVLANAFKSGDVRPESFGGPRTTTAQGSLIEAVQRAVAGTPLADLLSSAYDSDLRNTAGHNDFEVVGEGDDVEVRSTDGQQSWSAENLYQKVLSTTQFLDAVHTVAAYMNAVEQTDDLLGFRDVGTVSVGYAYAGEHRAPLVLLFQLWCFHRIDPGGSWVDDASLTIQTGDSEAEEIARLTVNAWSKGEPLSTSPFGDALAERAWATVMRVPVAPDLGLGLPHFTLPTGARYEIVGQPDEHVIPYLGVERLRGDWPE